MAERELDKKVLSSLKDDAALGRKLLANVENGVRRQDKWVSISEGYLRGCEEMLDLLINKGRDEVIKYILDVFGEVRRIDGWHGGEKELWERISTKVPAQWAFTFDVVLTTAAVNIEVAEARFVGAWGIVSDFAVLGEQYSFLSPEKNGIPFTKVTQIHNTAKTTRDKYKY